VGALNSLGEQARPDNNERGGLLEQAAGQRNRIASFVSG
jgi:hypothetical protein